MASALRQMSLALSRTLVLAAWGIVGIARVSISAAQRLFAFAFLSGRRLFAFAFLTGRRVFAFAFLTGRRLFASRF